MEREFRQDPPIDIDGGKDRILLEGVERELYDFKDEEKEEDFYRVEEGLTPEIVRQISKEKHDPEWMLEFRLKSLEIYNRTKVPDWGPPIDGLDMDRIVTYVRPKTDMASDWNAVPEDIKNAFEKLGIPQAERESLAWVPSTIPSLSTIMYARMWRVRVWFTRIWRAL